MVFLTLMALAVSPEIKCTDIGLVDVLEKKQIPLVIETA
jgi:adenine deaminase